MLHFASPPVAASGGPFDYVWVVAMENMSYSDINGDTTDCPYINNTLFPLGVKFSSWACVASYGASQPNYLDGTGGSHQSTTTNANPPGDVAAEPSVFSLVEAAGKSWKAYHMSYALVGTPQSTTVTDGDGGTSALDGSNPIYAEHHCPATHYTELRNNTARVPKIDDFTRLTASADFSTTSLAATPNFAWISPDNDHNMHNGTSADAIASCLSVGDTELSNLIPILRGSFAFLNKKCLIIVWWDEGRTGVTDPPVFFCGSSTANVKVNTSSATAHNHYDLLSTIEWALGLGNCGRNDVGRGHCAEAFN